MRLESVRRSAIEARGTQCLSVFIAFLVIVVVTLLFPSTAAASASDVYLAQNSTGAANGADCADALAYSYFNDAANWGGGSNQIGPGTTVHICGTITGNAGTTGLTFQGSGSSGNPITLKFESGAKLQAPYWGSGWGSAAGAILIDGKSYIVIDGGATGNAGQKTFVANGIVQNTLNGTSGGACPGGSCTSQHDSVLIATKAVSDVTIQNISLLNTYVRTSQSDEAGQVGNAIDMLPGSNGAITIQNVRLSDSSTLAFADLTSGGFSTLTFANNELTRASAGLIVGQGNGNTGTIGTLNYDGNWLHDFGPTWNDGSCSSYNYHHDGLHIYSYSSALTGLNVIGNLYTGDMGAGTAWVYYEQYAGGTGSINIFNNIFNTYATTNCSGQGSRTIEFEGGSITGKIYNNTIIGAAHSGSIMSGLYNNGTPSADMDVRNNAIGGYLSYFVEGSGAASSSNNNNYDTTNGASWNTNPYNGTNLSNWKADCGCDSGSFTGSPNLNSSFVPNSGSILIGAGQNLTSQGITALDSDYSGAPRPASGNWDIGAYTSGASVTQPNPPVSLTATVN